jgi:serine protease Do
MFKKFLVAGALLLSGCVAPGNRLVKVVNDVIPKSAMIEVKAVMEMTEITFDDGGFSMDTSTRAVTFKGSAVFVSPNGHLVTCAHMFDEGTISTVTVITSDGHRYVAEILYQDTRRDLALVKISKESPAYATLADPRDIFVGQEVLAVGNPLGFEFSVTHGIVSALDRDNVGLYDALQTDTFINPGNSGGPLFNLEGQLVGINSRIVPPVDASIFTGLGFSVSTGQILEFLTKFRGLERSFSKVQYGRKN